MTPKKHILFIDGIPDDRKVKARKIEKDGTLRWRGSGSANLVSFLQTDLFNRSNIVFDTDRDQELPKQMIHAVFNQISDPDTHKITLKKAEDFYQHIPKHIPFFNIPSHIMQTTRDNIYRLLQGIDKLHVPKTVKIQPKSPADIYEAITKEGFSFPVIFRQAGDHGGISTIRVEDGTEQFYAFALDGRDYYLTQFTEYANEEGIYAKYRLVVVDGEVFLRHVIFSDSWIIHSESRTFMEKNKLDYGYAITDYKSQGATTKNVIIFADAQMASMNAFYTQVTRAKENITIYTENKEALLANLNKDARQKSTLDYTMQGEEIVEKYQIKKEILKLRKIYKNTDN